VWVSYFYECLALICLESDGVKQIVYKYRRFVIYKIRNNCTYTSVSAIIWYSMHFMLNAPNINNLKIVDSLLYAKLLYLPFIFPLLIICKIR